MKHDRARQAATVVRAPNLIIVDIARYRWRELVHQQIAADLDEDPRMMEPDIPPDPDEWIARWLRELRHNPPAPHEDDLHAGPTIPEQPVQHPANAPTVAVARSFWSYAEPVLK